jgi:hypothetical protein
MHFTNTYLDLYDAPAELTIEELTYFYNTVNHIKAVLHINIEITNRDHETLKGKEKEACALIYKSTTDDNDCFITVDNFFIHECFMEKFHGAYNLSFVTLEKAICHEIAHITQWQHCKKHSRITEELYNRVCLAGCLE